MTDKLDANTRKEIVKYRLDKAYESLREADLLADSKFFNTAMNRLYYAAYYALAALMIQSELEVATHKGIRIMLGQKFILTGIIEQEYGRIYQQLFQNRQASDYEDFNYCDDILYAQHRPQAEKFINRIVDLIKNESK